MTAQKLENCKGICVGFRDPKFLDEKKSKSTMQKPFAIWLRVSGWKFNVSDWHLKNGLTNVHEMKELVIECANIYSLNGYH